MQRRVELRSAIANDLSAARTPFEMQSEQDPAVLFEQANCLVK